MESTQKFEVIIVGGGLAGLTSAIHLAQQGRSILLLEKDEFPRHKVCGEYISNEVLPYLQSLGVNPFAFGAKQISRLEISTPRNKKVYSNLPLGGFGISRYRLDYELYKKAKEEGCITKTELVTDVDFADDTFTVKTKKGNAYKAQFVLGSFGKRSNLDKKLDRDFIKKKSPYLGVKIHASGDFDETKVALHNFKGGYCGVSKVENDHINLCYISDYKSFKKYKSIKDFQEKVVFQNESLRAIFSNTSPVFEAPITISQISFDSKPRIENHMLMVGDAAGMIHPLCGNGMGMAISSAQLVSTLLQDFFNGKIKNRNQLEKMYLSNWNKRFQKRLFFGHKIASIFNSDFLTNLMWNFVRAFPFIIPMIIKNTHGKELPTA
ncbi:MAG: FAD-dependent oxidoreductase [Flavobacteriaceae bacterium]|nr:FAD-dependent oxidoreductase [Flavobacteriaceae bacterium]